MYIQVTHLKARLTHIF